VWALFSALWSEHCSYKSSRIHLKTLPTQGPRVLQGPGENAGAVDIGDGLAAVFKIESHNHPSFIEPYQGAATGVGGILRDIFTMGARPIAVLDALRFGDPSDARTRHLVDGVVRGVGGYGNCVGVPTVGGELVFDPSYQGNPLVNVMAIGLMEERLLTLAAAPGPGNLVVLFGSTTGRDGIGGASVLASATFTHDDPSKRPSVQVGDPFAEKLLIEASLELIERGLVEGLQDLGAGGITCATSETADRAGTGILVDLDAIPRREPGMEPFEVMISESQERMLAIVQPEDLDKVLAICERWAVRARVVGRVTHGGALRILDGDGGVLADVPASSLHDAAPLYHRPLRPRDRTAERDPSLLPAPDDASADVLGMLSDPAWIWRQYDHQLFLNTVVGPGGDATLLRLKDPISGEDTGRALALTTDGNHRWCAVSPRAGTARVVAEAVLNLSCVGARPLALVNCLNFGNPEHPEVMWELSEAIDGMAEACRALGLPVVGGNVSLYNETRGRDIDPTPVVGVLGLVDSVVRRPPGASLAEGGQVLVLGGAFPALAGSRWAWEQGAKGGSIGMPDLAAVAALAGVVRDLVADDLLLGLHDVADGGLALAVAELAAMSGVGVVAGQRLDHLQLVGESPDRVVVCVDPGRVEQVAARAAAEGVEVRVLGRAGGARLVLGPLVDLAVTDVVEAWRGRLPGAFGTAVTH
jgi:phosphoribosylformylglycinamidine synthase